MRYQYFIDTYSDTKLLTNVDFIHFAEYIPAEKDTSFKISGDQVHSYYPQPYQIYAFEEHVRTHCIRGTEVYRKAYISIDFQGSQSTTLWFSDEKYAKETFDKMMSKIKANSSLLIS